MSAESSSTLSTLSPFVSALENRDERVSVALVLLEEDVVLLLLLVPSLLLVPLLPLVLAVALGGGGGGGRCAPAACLSA